MELSEATNDELWDALAEVGGRERVDVLLELASRAHEQRDLGRAQSLLAEAESGAREVGDDMLVALCQYHQGDLCVQSHEYGQARERFGASAQGFLDVGDGVRAAQALVGLAQAEHAAHEWAACLEAAAEGVRIAESEDAPEIAGEACFLQARALYYLDRDREALDAAARARDFFRVFGDPRMVARVDDFTITVALYVGELDRALELARGHLVLTRGADGQEDPDALLRLAEVQNRRGEPREALSCAERARGMHRARGTLTGVARSEMVRANALERLDRLEEALGAFIEAGVLFDANGWDADALYAQIRQAIVLHALARYLEAARLNRDLTVRYLARPGDEVTAHWCLARLLDNLFEAHDYDGILATFDEFAPAWPEGTGVGEAVYRECLGFRAAALEELGERAQATVLADEVIAATPAREASVATALCFEIRGRSSSDESRASQDLAHAIALHVARGKEARARQLSEHFLAEEGMDPGRGKPVG